MKKTKKTKNTGKVAMEIGAGLAAAGAAVAAGYYFYGSKSAKKHRKIAAKWATAMKTEAIKEAKRLPKVGPKTFAAIVGRVAKTYQSVRSVDMREVRRAANELKANWDTVQRETKRTVRKGVSQAKKTVVKRIK